MKTTINKNKGVITVALLLSGLVPSATMAQDKVEASVGVDLVSGYIWRGQDLGGVSIQPSWPSNRPQMTQQKNGPQKA